MEGILSGRVMELLGELQTLSDSMDKMEARRREALAEKNRIEEKLEEARHDAEQKTEEHHALDIERRKKELLLRSEKERQQRIKGRVGEVKTSREYQAVISETNASKQTISTLEEALLKDMEALESLEAEVKKLEEKVERIEADANAACEKFDSTCEETEGQIASGKQGEKAILDELPPEVVTKYRLIRSRLGGVAVAEAKDEACTACFMRIPPQRFIEVMRGLTVVQCPNCYRILIPAKKAEE
jgi:predicted  nucleic acid-binding Zn-ribbon protein